MRLSGTVRDMASQSTCTQTDTRNDGQNDLFQCFYVHLAEITNNNNDIASMSNAGPATNYLLGTRHFNCCILAGSY